MAYRLTFLGGFCLHPAGSPDSVAVLVFSLLPCQAFWFGTLPCVLGANGATWPLATPQRIGSGLHGRAGSHVSYGISSGATALFDVTCPVRACCSYNACSLFVSWHMPKQFKLQSKKGNIFNHKRATQLLMQSLALKNVPLSCNIVTHPAFQECVDHVSESKHHSQGDACHGLLARADYPKA
jgi:hypothetical protein